VGFEHGDDAAVYRLTDELALVQTVDVFTPVVDEPYHYGAIAVANALSDVYAKGARPLLGLNIVGWPRGKLPLTLLGEILQGGAAKAREAGVLIAGGHTVDDPEPKYGLAVTGVVHPDRVVTNAGGRPGDVLVLTKPIGIGAITTGIKQGKASAEAAEAAIRLMGVLNRGAAEAMVEVGVHACTDVTGFGLLGHLHELALASGVGAVVEAGRVPVLPEAADLVRAGAVAGGTARNLEFLADRVQFDETIPEEVRILLADAQTSGGLLMAVPPERVGRLEAALRHREVPTAARIGTLVEGPPGHLSVSP
jgi:selenide,water dikinase